jgi:hypothetical protein
VTRDEFIDLLARLVADGELTELDAADLLAEFDAGKITDVPSVLPTPEAIRPPDDKAPELALLALLALMASPGAPGARPTLRPLPPLASVAMANAVQSVFERNVTNLAAALSNGDIALMDWQRSMLAEVEDHVLQQMYLANGDAVLTPLQRARLQTHVAEQGAYLQRFADQAALRAGQGTPFAEGYIANRSRLYGGAGRGEFFRGSEEAGVARGDVGDGVVVRYIAVDDKGTCSPCHNAQGYYLPGDGPMPGAICLGAGYCRCRREPEYNPSMYRNLGGR